MNPSVFFRMLLIGLMTVLMACNAPDPAVPVPEKPPMASEEIDFQKGIVYASWRHGEYASSESDRTLTHSIKPLGVNWIAVVVTCYQQSISTARIQCEPETLTPTDADLAHVIKDAHRAGLRVMLKPHIDMAGKSKHWRGQIGVGMDETTWRSWFRNYTDFITHYATVARDNDADYFVVGTELVNTSSHSEEWRNIIKAVRSIYHGPLTYSAHHMDEEFTIDWWDALDAIGIDAYYPLAQEKHPTVAQIRSAWKPIVSRLDQLAKKWDRRIILTEVGYESMQGVNRTPWQTRGDKIEYEEQADSYQALFEAFSGRAWWQGVYWWVWTVKTASALNRGFTPSNKPAEDILRKNYGAVARPAAPPVLHPAQSEDNQLIIYRGALATDWEDWSWDSTAALTTSKEAEDEKTSISLTMHPWGAFSLHHPGLDTTPYQWLEFYVHTGKNTQLLVSFSDASDRELPRRIALPDPKYTEDGKPSAGRWQRVRIPIAEMAARNTTITRLNIKNNSDQHPPVFFIDEISLSGTPQSAGTPQR